MWKNWPWGPPLFLAHEKPRTPSVKMMPSHEQTLRRRSSRLAEKRWSAHFQKCNRTVPNYVISWIRNATAAASRGYCPDQKIPGVYDDFTNSCYYITDLYKIYMEYPCAFVRSTNTVKNCCISEVVGFLNVDQIRFPKNPLTKELNSVLLDFLQMCDYLHLYA